MNPTTSETTETKASAAEHERRMAELRDSDAGAYGPADFNAALDYCDELASDRDRFAKELEQERAKLQAAEAVRDSALAVLEDYADPEFYFAIGFFPDHPCGDFIDDFSDCGPEFGEKPGKKAREFLNTHDAGPGKEAAVKLVQCWRELEAANAVVESVRFLITETPQDDAARKALAAYDRATKEDGSRAGGAGGKEGT